MSAGGKKDKQERNNYSFEKQGINRLEKRRTGRLQPQRDKILRYDCWSVKVFKGIHGRGRSGEEQSNKGTRNWGNEDNKYGNEEAAVAWEIGTDEEETGRLRDNEQKKSKRRGKIRNNYKDERLKVKVKAQLDAAWNLDPNATSHGCHWLKKI